MQTKIEAKLPGINAASIGVNLKDTGPVLESEEFV